jgi:hypothetical protein
MLKKVNDLFMTKPSKSIGSSIALHSLKKLYENGFVIVMKKHQ